ncbi:MAG TPA: TetR/AcrR family transcriptional regulator [Solirubrobacteraceae bacterium]|jgi:AcrR family transcriptional regulator|nr:TetR/AcrR family transcriptional regulator [Solirubrobacteraceae bacterium]
MARRERSGAVGTSAVARPPLVRERRRPRGQRPSAQIAVPRDGLPAGQLVEIQRSRLLAGAVGAIDEFGYAQATVAHITSRARVSRRTFYELFENREACLLALIEDVVAMLRDELARAGLDGLSWRERVRGGLAVILGFCDREPALARVCVVQALRGGPGVLTRREEILARLAGVLDEGRGESARAADCTPLTGEGLVGAAFGIVYARLARGERMPLSDLLGDLMGMIVLPYLGPAAARREQTRPMSTKGLASEHTPSALAPAHGDPLQEVPMRLTYRTARVLECVAVQPGVSNRGVADSAGVSDQGQISKLLARLERLGLVVNTGEGHHRGEPNAWTLTQLGREVAQRLAASNRDRQVA